MTTNSKNSRMRYHGYNNNRMYQRELAIKKEKRELKRDTDKFIFSVLKSIGIIFGCILCFFVTNKQKEKAESKRIEKKLEEAKTHKEQAIKSHKRKSAIAAKEDELINQWTKNIGKFINGKYITVSLEDYRKMTDKERKEWNETKKKEDSGIVLL